MDNMGYLKLELGLFLMPKDHLADSLEYNSLKVCACYSSRSFGNHFKCIICLFNIHFFCY
jgi:hypothetical protein